MNYRPITDMWILARPKLKDSKKYYGAYPAGFLERARALMGVHINDPVLHVCGGQAKYYPYKGGFGPNDRTLDLDPEMKPDYLQDARDRFPMQYAQANVKYPWSAVIADPPYDSFHADKYKPKADNFPKTSTILKNSLDVIMDGGRVGILGWESPRPPKSHDVKLIATIGVWLGWHMRIRVFTVYEKRD